MARKENRQKPLPSSISFFETVIGGHRMVEDFHQIGENIYEIIRIGSKPTIKVLLVDIYVVSEADVFEIISTNNNLDCILLVGYCNSTTVAAKEKAKSENIGLFDFREFMGAINFTGEKFINYEPKRKDN